MTHQTARQLMADVLESSRFLYTRNVVWLCQISRMMLDAMMPLNVQFCEHGRGIEIDTTTTRELVPIRGRCQTLSHVSEGKDFDIAVACDRA